jgi:O6-methylguanine-DNA--protein-cysteine methyltransferase
VVKSSKELGGYSLGAEVKEQLINFEKKIKAVVE